jgi:endoribonuclease LACTB2
VNILNVGYDSTNYYLIGSRTPRLLLDVGFPRTVPKLRKRIEGYGSRLEDVTHLVVTHFHPDHAGAAQELKNLGVNLVVWETQLEFIEPLAATMKPNQGYVPITPSGNLELNLCDSRAWLETLGIPGEVIATPGHSDDSVSLLLDDGIAFTGDLRPPTMVSDNPNEPVNRSWARIGGFGIRTVYPGHGPRQRLE